MSDSDNSSTSKDYSGKLPKLIVKGNTHNYGEWSIQSEIQLLGQGLWKYVVGPESNPPVIPPLRQPFTQYGIDKHGVENEINVPGNAQERQKAIDNAKPWIEKNDYTRAVICKSLDNRQLHRVKHIPYASQVWESLRQKFIKPNSALSNSNKSSLITYLCTPEMDVATWLDDMERLYDDLTDIDPDALSDHEYALLLMNNLPETTEWRSLAGGLRKRVEECNQTNIISAIRTTPKPWLKSLQLDTMLIKTQNAPQSVTVHLTRHLPTPPQNVLVYRKLAPILVAGKLAMILPIVSPLVAQNKAFILLGGRARGISTFLPRNAI